MNRNNIERIVTVIIFITIIGLLIIGLIKTNDYSTRLESQIEERDHLIKIMSERDSLVEKLLTKKDTTKFLSSSFAIDGKTISSSELVRYVNDLNRRIRQTEDSISYYRTYYKMFQQRNKDVFVAKKDSGHIIYQLSPKSINIDTVRQLFTTHRATVDTLSKEINELRNKLSMYQKAVDKYGIQFDDIKQNNNTISFIIKAPKVDSALLLFPRYKKKLKRLK